jgi:hypothetical protein
VSCSVSSLVRCGPTWPLWYLSIYSSLSSQYSSNDTTHNVTHHIYFAYDMTPSTNDSGAGLK